MKGETPPSPACVLEVSSCPRFHWVSKRPLSLRLQERWPSTAVRHGPGWPGLGSALPVSPGLGRPSLCRWARQAPAGGELSLAGSWDSGAPAGRPHQVCDGLSITSRAARQAAPGRDSGPGSQGQSGSWAWPRPAGFGPQCAALGGALTLQSAEEGPSRRHCGNRDGRPP